MLGYIAQQYFSKRNYIVEEYLRMQLLIPCVKDLNNKDKLYIISGHYVNEYTHKKVDNKYVITFKFDIFPEEFFYPKTFTNKLDVIQCEYHLSRIFLGIITPSPDDWLVIFPEFVDNVDIIMNK